MASQVENIKWVPGTRFIVDGFKFQSPNCIHYFLTHAHSDHTIGLNKSFDSGLIYCSPITYTLLVHDMGIAPHILRPLEINQTTHIDGVLVTPICANHCPGAVCFIFQLPSTTQNTPGTTIFHTGDFRWCSEGHGKHPLLSSGVDVLMLDTTYLNPKWVFPTQAESVRLMAETLQKEEIADPGTLFACSSYHIGKERAYFGAAAALQWKIWVTPAKRRVLNMLHLPKEWMELLTESEKDAKIHVLGLGEQLHEQSLADRIAGTHWTRIVLIRPTGWSYRKSGVLQRREDGCVTTIGIPYSEHSSYEELQDCVKTLRPKKLVPTVNAGDATKARALVDKLCGFMDLSTDRSRLDSYFLPAANGKKVDAVKGEVAQATCSNGGGNGIGTSIEGINTEQIIVLPGSKWYTTTNRSQHRDRIEDNKDNDDVIDLNSVDIEEQRKLLAEAAERARKKQKVDPNNNKAAAPKAGTP